MRNPVPENKIVFVRFHKEVYEMIEEYAKSQNKKKATVVSQILEEYISSPFPLSSLSSRFFLKRGRSQTGRVISKGMNVTMKKVINKEIQIRADEEEMKENDFRTAIIYSYIKREKE